MPKESEYTADSDSDAYVLSDNDVNDQSIPLHGEWQNREGGRRWGCWKERGVKEAWSRRWYLLHFVSILDAKQKKKEKFAEMKVPVGFSL